jgi:TAT (twin-arginine translocation) pathway signal sequence
MPTKTRNTGPSRRQFLKGVGAAGAGLVAGSVGGASTAPPAAIAAAAPRTYARHSGGAPDSSVDFERMFPNLSPFAEANDTVRAA